MKNKSKMKKETNRRCYHLYQIWDLLFSYWDDNPNKYHKVKGKRTYDVTNIQYRTWRTWKHTRKTQWK